jgi:DNA-binding transcriptional LysR family regulator
MTLTPAGRVFLDRTEKALDSLRSGHRDLNALDLTELSALSLGVIEDFENEVTPTLTARLAEAMSQCAFRLQTGPSHELAARIGERELDIAICAAPDHRPAWNGVASAGARPLYPRRSARHGRLDQAG